MLKLEHKGSTVYDEAIPKQSIYNNRGFFNKFAKAPVTLYH